MARINLKEKNDRKLKVTKLKHKTNVHKTSVDSPLAKYDNLGNLTCVICRVPVKTNLWRVHINSKQHKNKLDIVKQLKSNLPTRESFGNLEISNLNCLTTGSFEGSYLQQVDKRRLQSGNSVFKQKVKLSAEPDLPKEFFDKSLANVRDSNIEYMNFKDLEWERFKSEIKKETLKSYEIATGEQIDLSINRQINEIDDQMKWWSKFFSLVNHKKNIYAKESPCPAKNSFVFGKEENTLSENEFESFEEFSDWRSKTYN